MKIKLNDKFEETDYSIITIWKQPTKADCLNSLESFMATTCRQSDISFQEFRRLVSKPIRQHISWYQHNSLPHKSIVTAIKFR